MMFFSLGPVMRYELITTSRRRRYYLVRMIYGLFLLSQLWNLFTVWEAQHQSGGSIDEIQLFAEDAFIRFAGVQGLGLLFLIPALVAGIIADEHQRKTLHYLLASRLSSAEIVLGKLGARMVHVLAFIAVGLPIVSLLMLYGGLNPVNIFYVYLGTTTLVLFVAGFSMLISILSRRPRDAVLAAYGLLVLWLIAPLFVGRFAEHLTEGPLGWVKPVNDALLLGNPITVWSTSTMNSSFNRRGRIPVLIGGAIRWVSPTRAPGWWRPPGFEWEFARMAGVQAVCGLGFLTMAVAGLRPLRGTSWPLGSPRTLWWTRFSSRWRRLAGSRATTLVSRNELLSRRANRPSCGEDPMLWKERYTQMGGALKWLGSRPVALFFSVLLGCYLLDVTSPVIADMAHGHSYARTWKEFNEALRTSSAALAILALLPISAAAASSLTSEREADTWTSLATTLLTPIEIVRAKQLGAIWSARWIGIGILAIWATGLFLAAIHPIGLLAAAGIVLSAFWLVSATGVLASTLARNSTRAVLLTFVAVFLFVLATGWPALHWGCLVSYREMAIYWNGTSPLEVPPPYIVPPSFALAASVTAVLSLIAGVLTFWTIKRLLATWGRP
jgi:ABC-type transport system involved in multi-copper enzyme maturation permease subunit